MGTVRVSNPEDGVWAELQEMLDGVQYRFPLLKTNTGKRNDKPIQLAADDLVAILEALFALKASVEKHNQEGHNLP